MKTIDLIVFNLIYSELVFFIILSLRVLVRISQAQFFQVQSHFTKANLNSERVE